MIIRDFRMGDQEELSRLIRRTLIEVNTDCPKDEVAFLYDLYTPEKVIANAEAGHTIVFEEDGVLIGTGTIVPDGMGEGNGSIMADFAKGAPVVFEFEEEYQARFFKIKY